MSRPTSNPIDRTWRTQKGTASRPNRAMGAIVGGSAEPRGIRSLGPVKRLVPGHARIRD